MRPPPPVRATQIAQLFKAEAVNIAVSASKDGKLRVVYAGWGGPPRWRCPLGEGPVADNGIDAQWQGDLSAEALTAGPFLSAGAKCISV